MKLTSKDIANWLVHEHSEYGGWNANREVPFGRRRIDVLAIALGGTDVIGFEVKVSRGDFFNELRQPEKSLAVRRFCTQFYFVTPYDLVKPHELPDSFDSGLIYCDLEKSTTVKPIVGKSSFLCLLEQRRIMHAMEDADIEAAEIETEIPTNDEEYELFQWDFCATSDDDPFGLPDWMLPRYRKPLAFDFDVEAASLTLPRPVVQSIPSLNFSEVPF